MAVEADFNSWSTFTVTPPVYKLQIGKYGTEKQHV